VTARPIDQNHSSIKPDDIAAVETLVAPKPADCWLYVDRLNFLPERRFFIGIVPPDHRYMQTARSLLPAEPDALRNRAIEAAGAVIPFHTEILSTGLAPPKRASEGLFLSSCVLQAYFDAMHYSLDGLMVILSASRPDCYIVQIICSGKVMDVWRVPILGSSDMLH
jgi:hypothetical protein